MTIPLLSITDLRVHWQTIPHCDQWTGSAST